MLRGFLGWENFRSGLQEYIREYSLRNAEMQDLWRTFEAVTDGVGSANRETQFCIVVLCPFPTYQVE